MWQPELDILVMDIDNLLEALSNVKYTKHVILRVADRIFDSLGLIPHFKIRLKYLLQELWIKKVSWNDYLPRDNLCIWEHCISELLQLNKLQITQKITKLLIILIMN